MAAASALDPADQNYFQQQNTNTNDTYQIGLADNASAKSLSDLTYDQKLNALQDTLSQQQSQLPDSYAARGLSNSGVYNYGKAGAGSLGAWQQFIANKNESLLDLNSQKFGLDSQFAQKTSDLGLTNTDNLATIAQTEAVDNAQQAAADAIAGG